MPKEYVYDENKVVNESSGEEEPLNPNRVKVTWNREAGYVQIATVNPEYEDLMSDKSGWYVDLDRRGINYLIRILRRARDQSFGRDE